MHPKIVIIDQARMASTRLPGKILKTVLGKPLLEYQLERLRRVQKADEIIVATTTQEQDAVIAEFCGHQKVTCFRGSENDVLGRFLGAAMSSQADIIVRVTSDCPLVDPVIIDQVIAFYLSNQARYDYVSNVLHRTYPRGLDCEVLPVRVLRECHVRATTASDREHVTSFIYAHPDLFRLGEVKRAMDFSEHRWTVDTQEDFEVVRRILESLYRDHPSFGWEDCLRLVKQHPDWTRMNSHVQQKPVIRDNPSGTI